MNAALDSDVALRDTAQSLRSLMKRRNFALLEATGGL